MSVSENPILIVENNDDDLMLVRRTLSRAGIHPQIRAVTTGIEAIAYLRGDSDYSDRTKYPFPSMVLLDLKLPGMNGFEVLRWVRQQCQFEDLCVVVLTASDEIRDANLAYKLGANSFLVKPLDFVNATELVESLERMLSKARSQTLEPKPEPIWPGRIPKSEQRSM